MPVDAVRFIHEAKDDNAKGRLFEAARSGHVAVLIGSTAKMGVGTNMQNLLVAIHTSTAHGAPRTSSSATAAASVMATRTPSLIIGVSNFYLTRAKSEADIAGLQGAGRTLLPRLQADFRASGLLQGEAVNIFAVVVVPDEVDGGDEFTLAGPNCSPTRLEELVPPPLVERVRICERQVKHPIVEW